MVVNAMTGDRTVSFSVAVGVTRACGAAHVSRVLMLRSTTVCLGRG